jgi:hypothetical protein
LLSNENEEEKHEARRIEERDCYQFFFLLTEEMTNTGGSSRAARLQRLSPLREIGWRKNRKEVGTG